jgi:hypothetical protein
LALIADISLLVRTMLLERSRDLARLKGLEWQSNELLDVILGTKADMTQFLKNNLRYSSVYIGSANLLKVKPKDYIPINDLWLRLRMFNFVYLLTLNLKS